MSNSRKALATPRSWRFTGFTYLMAAIGCAALSQIAGLAQESANFFATRWTGPLDAVDTKDLTAPVFRHGYILRFLRLPDATENTNIYVWDASGKLEQAIRAWPASATKLFITSVDVGPNSELVYAGEATYPNGSKSAFIAQSHLDGTALRYFTTATYLATQLSVADDGTIWTVGAEHVDMHKGPNGMIKRWENYDVLRHFNSSGDTLDHLLPRWGSDIAYTMERTDSAGEKTLEAFDKLNQRVTEFHAPFFGYMGGFVGPSSIENQTWLRATPGGVVLYDGRSGVLWRYTAATRALTSAGVNIQAQRNRKLNGFAVSTDGNIYGSLQSATPEIRGMVGLYELRQPSPQELYEWVQIPAARLPDGPAYHPDRLLGSDGNSLVFSMAGQQLTWAEVSGGTPREDR